MDVTAAILFALFSTLLTDVDNFMYISLFSGSFEYFLNTGAATWITCLQFRLPPTVVATPPMGTGPFCLTQASDYA